MVIHRVNERVPTFVVQPRLDVDQWKSPRQQQLERETFIKNDQTKRIALEAAHEYYRQLEKLVENTAFRVSLSIDNLGGVEQYRLTTKKDGKEIAALPPDVAIEIAEKAKHTTLGLLFDLSA